MPATPVTFSIVEGPAATLQGPLKITADGNTGSFSGFAAVASIEVLLFMRHVSADGTVTVDVEHSNDDGAIDPWTVAATHDFTGHGRAVVSIDAPKNYLRVAWTFSAPDVSAFIQLLQVTRGLAESLSVLSDGIVFSGLGSAPADADLAAGDFALWLDPTNGAAKLKVKAKQANGTVVTGSVNLSA